MTSPFEQLFSAICDRLKSQVSALQHIDQDLGQLEDYKLRPAVTFPCALVDVDDFEFTDLAHPLQMAEGFIMIRLALPLWSHSGATAPAAVRTKALEYCSPV